MTDTSQEEANKSEGAASGISDSQDLSRRTFVPWAVFVIALGAALRFLFIGKFEIWLDEAYCFEVASRNAGGLFKALAAGNEPPLHLVTLHYWMRAFGTSPVALRSLSAIASTGSIAVILCWRTVWLSRRARLLSAFVLAITPIAIYYGQVTRMYSLLVLLVLLNMVFLERGLRFGGFRNWMVFSLITSLSLYTSYVAIYLVPVGYLVIGCMYLTGGKREDVRKRLSGLFLAHVAAAVLFSPWLPVFARQPSAKAVLWIKPFWQQARKAMLPLESLSVMTTGGAYYPQYLAYMYQGPDRTETTRKAISEGKEDNPVLKILTRIPPPLPLVLSSIVCVILFTVAVWRGFEFPARTFLLSWLLLSFGVPILLSFIRPVFIVGRYELPGVPAFAILTGIGLSRLDKKVRAAFIASLVLLFVYAWSYAYSWPTTGDSEGKGAILARTAGERDIVVCEGFDYTVMYYYVGPKRKLLRFITIPRDTLEHSAWFDYDKWLTGPGYNAPRDALVGEAQAALDTALNEVEPGRAVVLVRPTKPAAWQAAIDKAADGPIVRLVESGRLIPDPSTSSPGWGILVFRRGM